MPMSLSGRRNVRADARSAQASPSRVGLVSSAHRPISPYPSQSRGRWRGCQRPLGIALPEQHTLCCAFAASSASLHLISIDCVQVGGSGRAWRLRERCSTSALPATRAEHDGGIRAVTRGRALLTGTSLCCVRLVQLRNEVDAATLRAETAEALAKEREQIPLERDNDDEIKSLTHKYSTSEEALEAAATALAEAKAWVRDLYVKAEQAERQQGATEKERDQWEAKAEVLFPFLLDSFSSYPVLPGLSAPSC
ncbi:hypothetical protein B0H14DRAFT_3889175 [Mycena olivaceomarginata]|nr:hypothetical protein B0H14DRAFT_3889175 [Mycena olivaceomarginata]